MRDQQPYDPGFAMVAQPAACGEAGARTFIVNHNGTVSQRDLGPETTNLAPT